VTAARRTQVLFAALVGLVLLDLWAHRTAAWQQRPLPTLPAFEPATATWLALTHGDETLRMERSDDGWAVVQPYRHSADPTAVDAIVDVLAAGVVPDARVDAGEHDRYGLDGADPIRVEAGDPDQTLGALYVGNDAVDGATFVRFAGADEVYRARIGGRDRYDRPAGAWRNPRLLQLPVDRITSIAVARDDGQRIEIRRTPALGTGAPGAWTLADDPTFPVDPALADAFTGALASLQATEVLSPDHPAGLDPAGGTLTLTLDDGRTHELLLGIEGDAGFSTRPSRDAVYRLSGRLVHRLLADRDRWRDHTLLALDPAQIRVLEWIEGTDRVRLERDDRTGQWFARDPNLDIDARAVAATAGFLARARAERFVPIPADQAGLPGTRSISIVAERAWTLQLGAPAPGALDGVDAVYVRIAEQPDRIGLMEADLVSRLAQAFAR